MHVHRFQIERQIAAALMQQIRIPANADALKGAGIQASKKPRKRLQLLEKLSFFQVGDINDLWQAAQQARKLVFKLHHQP